MFNNINIKKSKASILLGALVFIKIVIYYVLMGVTANYVPIILLTVLYLIGIFSLFKNKITPAVLYFILSLLMFMDVGYFSYFNRNLSVAMMGAASLVGDVSESVKAVLKPVFFLLLIDPICVLLYTIFKKGLVSEKAASNKGIKKRLWGSLAALAMTVILVLNPTGNGLITSIDNQEFFTYHIKDALTNLNHSQNIINAANYEISTGSYESEKNSKLFGIAKKRNLIVIQVEALQNIMINAEYNGQEITPNLNKLIKGDTLYFNHYYQQLGSGNTSDAEFATQNSIMGDIKSYTYGLYANNYFRGLPWIMKDEGYKTAVFHGYKKDFWNRAAAYPAQGFDTFYYDEKFNSTDTIGMGISDEQFFKQSVAYMKQEQPPFYNFLITLSSHFPFQIPSQYQGIRLKSEDKGTLFGDYVNAVHYTDKAIGTFIEELKKNGLYDRSIIAIYGDHFGLPATEKEVNDCVTRFLGHHYDMDDMLNIPLIIHIPGKNINQTVERTGGQTDFLPTIASLLGVEKLNTLYFGHNMLTEKSGFVASQTYMVKGSFIQDDTIFEMSRDGVFANSRAWNTKTKQPVELNQCVEGYKRSVKEVDTCAYYLANDILRKVLVEHQDLTGSTNNQNKLTHSALVGDAGQTDQLADTNSTEALDATYNQGTKWIEVDLQWTSDDRTVLLDSWDNMKKLFGVENKRYSLNAFQKLTMENGFHQMGFGDLAKWLKAHPDAYVVLDVNEKVFDLFDGIKKKYPDLVSRIIPEINLMNDYTQAKSLGFDHVILKVNKGQYTGQQLSEFTQLNNIYAVNLPADSINEYKDFIKKGTSFVYAEGKVDDQTKKAFSALGVDGFISDNR